MREAGLCTTAPCAHNAVLAGGSQCTYFQLSVGCGYLLPGMLSAVQGMQCVGMWLGLICKVHHGRCNQHSVEVYEVCRGKHMIAELGSALVVQEGTLWQQLRLQQSCLPLNALPAGLLVAHNFHHNLRHHSTHLLHRAKPL